MRPVRSKHGARTSAHRGSVKTVVLRPTERSSQRRRARARTGSSRWAEALRSGAVRRPILVLTVLFVLCAAGVGLVAGGHVTNAFTIFARSTGDAFGKLGFAVSEIAIKGNERTPADTVYVALGVHKGQSVFDFDPASARARLRSLPWVAEVEVRRHYPRTISVVIVEKRPFALWKNGDDTAVIERSGAVITRTGLDEFARLPVVMGPGAPEAAAAFIDAIGGSRAVAARLKAAEWVSGRRWDLHLDGNVVVKLPELGWQREIAELEKLIVDKAVLERDIEVIDLRYPDRYIFRLHNGDSQPVPRERRA